MFRAVAQRRKACKLLMADVVERGASANRFWRPQVKLHVPCKLSFEVKFWELVSPPFHSLPSYIPGQLAQCDAFKESLGCVALLADSASFAMAVFITRHPTIPLLRRQDCQGPGDGRVNLGRDLEAVAEESW